MSRHNTGQDVKNNSSGKLKRILSNLSDVVNFIIYDKNGESIITQKKYHEEINRNDGEYNPEPVLEFTKMPINDEADNENFAEIFDSVKQEKSHNLNIDATDTKTKIPSVSKISASNDSNEEDFESDEIEEDEKNPDKIDRINITGAIKRILILVFSVICGIITMPFGMNPLGIAVICAADKYIFYIYSGLVVSLAFYRENLVVFFILYTIVAGVKFYVKYNREKSKAEMLSKSVSYNNLSKKERIRLLNLIHFNDAGSIIISILICAISCSAVGFIKIALKAGSIIYTDIAVIMLFMLMSMLFTYLYSGLFDIGKDNKTLEKAGMCSVIFTVIYFLAPYYLYTLSIGYLTSFVLTFIAANSGITKKRDKKNLKKNVNKEAIEKEEENINPDEEVINRFAVNIMNQDGVLSDMTRGALIGLLCGVALGDTAGAVTLGICGLVSGLFFSQSAVLAIIAGLVSAISYSVYVAGIEAIQRYIPNMLAGLTFYLPAAMFYSSFMRKINAGKYDKKSTPLLDKGLLIAELPIKKLNNLSDAFQGLSGIFYEISERFKTPNSNEIKAIVSACIEKTCEKCENYNSCELTEKHNINMLQKKCADYLSKNGRLNSNGITRIFTEQCVKISDMQNKINAVYCRKTEENIENNKTKIFADNYESIAKLLQNNIKSGKEDIEFKKEMSEKIFINLENMGIECENVIVMGERKKTVYIFGIKMSNYSGTISDITEMLERICGTWFDFPEYILKENYIIMKNQSRNKYKIYSVQMSKSAGEIEFDSENKNKNNEKSENTDSLIVVDAVSGVIEPESEPDFDSGDSADIKIEIEENTEIINEEFTKTNDSVNGDSVSIFNGKDGYQYGLISDGMGSGKNAALSSRLAVLMTEKLLSAGNQKDLTVEMLNSLLISKSDECFASVDLFEADLITGKATFIKAGAAPSFVVRNGKLFKIQSSTVPTGIIENINSEQTKFDMEDGDYILMLSDGIISTFEEGSWLIEMLGSEKNLKDPKNMLNNILREASKKNHRKDDMSLLFMKIAEERKFV